MFGVFNSFALFRWKLQEASILLMLLQGLISFAPSPISALVVEYMYYSSSSSFGNCYVVSEMDCRAYDRAAIKFRGLGADINFSLSDYDEDLKQVILETERHVCMNINVTSHLCVGLTGLHLSLHVCRTDIKFKQATVNMLFDFR